MKCLVVEDDFGSRILLQTVLSRYGECHVAVNGLEAVAAFRRAQASGHGYDLICMDIMMPEMDGQAALVEIRELEDAAGILSCDGAKVIMTTALDQPKSVIRAFYELCDAYLVKPIDTGKLLEHLKEFRLAA